MRSTEHAPARQAETAELPEIEVSVLMPCLSEAESVGSCIRKARQALAELGVRGEVVVADNGSTDGSQDIALALGAVVVPVDRKGYGSALMGGIAAARGRYIIMGDADASYDFSAIAPFIERLRDGYDLVMGNRFEGGIAPGAMPALHRRLGNPLLTAIGRLFFRSPVGDFHCGLRGFSREAVDRLDLQTTGMEFASEMVVKATLLGMRIAEVPTTLSPAVRNRPPHLRTWRDGWRHLRFLLLFSPRWLFFYPGLFLMMIGTLVSVWLLPGPRVIGRVGFDLQTLLYAAMAIVVGYQSVLFAVFTTIFGINQGLLPPDPRMDRLFQYITLEVGLALGFFLAISGLAGSVIMFVRWSIQDFGALDTSRSLRVVIPSLTCVILGSETVLASLFLSVLGLKRR